MKIEISDDATKLGKTLGFIFLLIPVIIPAGIIGSSMYMLCFNWESISAWHTTFLLIVSFISFLCLGDVKLSATSDK